MATATDTLTLAQWLSPAFPVGAFAYSHGLEWAIDCGDVQTQAQIRDWVAQVVQNGAGRNDMVLLAAAYRAENSAALNRIDATARAFAASKERLQETDLQGAAFCAAISDLHGFDVKGLTYPVALGRAAALARLPLELTAQMALQAVMSNLASIAMRLVPLGQSQGQAIIRDLTPLCMDVASAACTATLDDLSATCFLTDIAAMRHETQYARICRT